MNLCLCKTLAQRGVGFGVGVVRSTIGDGVAEVNPGHGFYGSMPAAIAFTELGKRVPSGDFQRL